jgi:hypothetical protein
MARMSNYPDSGCGPVRKIVRFRGRGEPTACFFLHYQADRRSNGGRSVGPEQRSHVAGIVSRTAGRGGSGVESAADFLDRRSLVYNPEMLAALRWSDA